MQSLSTSDPDRRVARLVMEFVAYATDVPAADIAAELRGTAAAAAARQLAMYLVNVGFGWSMSRIAAAFARDRSTVAYACQVVEGRREDPDFDASIAQLEALLERAPAPGAARRMVGGWA
jgi:chromosomal replication initiation ATPase DnaA